MPNSKTKVIRHPDAPRTSISIQNISVEYRVPSNQPANRRYKKITSFIGYRPRVHVQALNDVSFTVDKGDAVGILGLNGSGKSTLLRVIGGLETPDCGRVLASSQPILLGVSAALEPYLSGIQNIRLGCLAIGMHPDILPDAIKEIVDFVGIGDAIHLPMNTYSSGMAARLRFAIATAANPDILLIDEALATGDAAFKNRSREKMSTMLDNASTILLVSHQARTIEELCTKAVWLHQGVVIATGDAATLARQYRKWAWLISKDEKAKADRILLPLLERSGLTHLAQGKI